MAEAGIRSFGALRSSNRRRAIELFDSLRASQTTTSATYADVTNAIKAVVWPGGSAVVSITVSHSLSTTGDTAVEYQLIRDDTNAVLAGGTTWLFFTNTVGQHYAVTFIQLVNLPKGAYNIQLQWRRQAGTGTVTSDTNDIMHGVILPVF